MSAPHSAHSAIRLPDPGAGFVWQEHRSTVVLVPKAGVAAAFTTRVGGSCPEPWDTLNTSFSVGDGSLADWRELVWSNREIAGSAVGGRAEWAIVRQVHGADVVRAGAGDVATERAPITPRSADAIWTDQPGSTVAVQAADCCPVLLVGGDGVAAVHAGWRGLIAGVVRNAGDAVRATTVIAGPAIGPCCFEVGDDVRREFAGRFGPRVTGGGTVDLWSAVEVEAERLGATDVRTARICTSCHPELFFSHRRDGGVTGRQALVARL